MKILRPIDVAHLQAPGAYPNGTRVAKQKTQVGDGHRSGDRGTVRGSFFGETPEHGPNFCYFVEWDDLPGVAVGIMARKVERCEE